MELITFLQTHQLFYIAITAFFGLCMGSFLNVVIYRLPSMLQSQWRVECVEFLEGKAPEAEGINLFTPRSHCPNCKKTIRAWENIPLLSYLFLGGKCGNCTNPISFRYPMVELITAALSIFIAIELGFSWEALWGMAFTWALISLVVIDLDHQLLPDNITIPILWLGIILSLYEVYVPAHDAILGAVFGYLSLWSFAGLFKLITGKEGMGHGDFKLFAMLGAWLGWQLLPFVILCASLVGAIVGISLMMFNGHDRKVPIAFGPFLATAGWIAFFWGYDITNFYLKFSGIIH